MSEYTIDFDPRPTQWEVHQSLNRFNVLLAHRRFGKTVLAVNTGLRKTLTCKRKKPQGWYFCPTFKQARRVAWNYVKEYAGPLPGRNFNESDLRVDLPGGGTFQLGSADNPDDWRGIYGDFIILDEPAQMPTRMWSEILRPALSDRLGGMLAIGTPQGRHGLFFDLYQDAPNHEDWWRGCYKNSETHIIPPEEVQAMARTMSKSELEQELECSFLAAIRGAFWGETLNELEQKDPPQITHVPHDPRHRVYTSWDIGWSDSTSVWMFQVIGGTYRFIWHYEVNNRSLPEIVADLRDLAQRFNWTWGTAIVPHDIRKHDYGTGQTYRSTLSQLGFETKIAPDVGVMAGIEEARNRLKVCWFDVENCKHGLECLRSYKADWDDKHGVLRKVPLHNWASHASDSFRMFAVTDTSVYSRARRKQPLDYSMVDRAVI